MTLGSSNASHGVVAVIAVKGPPARADRCLTTDDIPAPPTESVDASLTLHGKVAVSMAAA